MIIYLIVAVYLAVGIVYQQLSKDCREYQDGLWTKEGYESTTKDLREKLSSYGYQMSEDFYLKWYRYVWYGTYLGGILLWPILVGMDVKFRIEMVIFKIKLNRCKSLKDFKDFAVEYGMEDVFIKSAKEGVEEIKKARDESE